MKLSASDQATYPKFTQYVKRKMPELVNVGPVMYNLQTKGTLSKAEAIHALKWGNEPLIVITDLSHGQCGVPAAYGCTRGANLDRIEIDKQTVDDFESSAYSLGVGKNARGQNVFIVGVTLLHELCHWGRFRHAKAEPVEMGDAFEKSTYGKSVP